MYLRFATKLEFKNLASLLSTDLIEDILDWNYENVYEWMWVDLPQFDLVLNISREDGGTDVDDELLDQLEGDDAAQRALFELGPTYVNAWTRGDRDRVNELPDSLAELFAARLNVDIAVFADTHNIDASSFLEMYSFPRINTPVLWSHADNADFHDMPIAFSSSSRGRRADNDTRVFAIIGLGTAFGDGSKDFPKSLTKSPVT